jgi:AcrR family transcriptional regulator
MGRRDVKAYGTNSKRTGYKLAQLCQTADFHPSTVHYYVKIGLLHKPRKVGLGVFLYDDSHLKTLNKIRSLRRSQNLPLSDIKDRLQSDPEIDHQTGTAKPREGLPGQEEGPALVRGNEPVGSTRMKILDVATELFSKKGYEGARISDITDTLDMAKGSFYLHFKDKRELFIACMERLAYVILPEHTGEAIARKGDYTGRLAEWTVAFLEAFPSYAGILNLVKMAAFGEDAGLAQKANEAIASIVKPILRDFRRAVAEGMVRDMDEEFFAYTVLGIAENIGYRLTTDPNYDLHHSVEKYVDLISRGVMPQTDARLEAAEARRPSGKITDVRGEAVKVREISFGGKPYLLGRIGEGEIRLDTEKIAFILVDHTGPGCIVEVTMTNNEKTTLEQDGNLIVSAASSVGLYTIPFHRLRSISFA